MLNNKWADSIYNGYSAQIHTAKSLLLYQGIQCNTQHGILKDFDTHFSEKGLYNGNFKTAVMRMNEIAPSGEFANEYLEQAKEFIEFAKVFREKIVLAEK